MAYQNPVSPYVSKRIRVFIFYVNRIHNQKSYGVLLSIFKASKLPKAIAKMVPINNKIINKTQNNFPPNIISFR